MTKLSFALLLLSACNGLMSMDIVKLPSQKEIARRLNGIGLDHFVGKTKIHTTLGDSEAPLNQVCVTVCVTVDKAIYDYNKNDNEPHLHNLMNSFKPDIIKIILQDHPTAIDFLKEGGVLK